MKLRDRYKRLTIWNKAALWGALASLLGLALTVMFYFIESLNKQRSSLHLEAMITTLLPLASPVLVTPAEGAAIPQHTNSHNCPDGLEIYYYFDWNDVNGAAEYQLYVRRRTARLPALDIVTHQSLYAASRCASVVDQNLEDWEWRVRAISSNGTAGLWSEHRQFQYEACRTPQHVRCQDLPVRP